MERPGGHVWIVGAGPGDPGLITVAGAEAIAGADVILYDALAPKALLSRARAEAELVYVGKRAGKHALTQAEIERELVAHACAGKLVVRLKGGDPFVFGRGGEEAIALRAAGVGYTVVPGITSAIAAPAYAGIPVTHRGLSASFMVVTGSAASDDEGGAVDWEAAARAGTLVILMGMTTLEAIVSRLLAGGRAGETPAACVQWGTTQEQRVVVATLATIAAEAENAGLAAPVVTVVGEVAGLAAGISWFVPGPLAGNRVVVTRARAQTSDLAARLEALGATVVETPTIAVRPTPEGLVLDERVGSRWDWIVFTSANGVDVFFDALAGPGKDARALGTTRVAAVGSATAEALRQRGVVADFVPSRATSATLGEEIEGVRGARMLLAVSALTDGRLADKLRGRGAMVEQIAVYDTVAEPIDSDRVEEVLEASAITFTSASTARNLRAALNGRVLAPSIRLVSIGPETSAAVREAFGRLDREAATPSIEALVEAVAEALAWD